MRIRDTDGVQHPQPWHPNGVAITHSTEAGRTSGLLCSVGSIPATWWALRFSDALSVQMTYRLGAGSQAHMNDPEGGRRHMNAGGHRC